MCKNSKKYNHSHKRETDKTIECVVIDNEVKELLEGCKEKRREKFDYKRFIKKNRGSVKYRDLDFVPSGYGNQVARVHLDNGYDVRVVLGKDSFVEDIEIEFNYQETGKRMSLTQVFPQLSEQRESFLHDADIKLVESAIRLANGLPSENQEEFLDRVHNEG